VRYSYNDARKKQQSEDIIKRQRKYIRGFINKLIRYIEKMKKRVINKPHDLLTKKSYSEGIDMHFMYHEFYRSIGVMDKELKKLKKLEYKYR
jgi:hypothetical protein